MGNLTCICVAGSKKSRYAHGAIFFESATLMQRTIDYCGVKVKLFVSNRRSKSSLVLISR